MLNLTGLTYNDVLIRPALSDIDSRDEVDVRTSYLGQKRLPFISAPMDYVTGVEMADEMIRLGAYAALSRFGMPEDGDYINQPYAISVGIKQVPSNTIDRLSAANPHAVCIDVAHGHHRKVYSLIREIVTSIPSIFVIAGNVATYDGFAYLADAGADAIRVGIGPGSACSTRDMTGIGVPQLGAIYSCQQYRKGHWSPRLIADGGIQTPGDIAKALAAGADAVMLGQMLAGHDESPGPILYEEIAEEMGTGRKVYDTTRPIGKAYRGQSLLGSNGARLAPEGIEGTVPYRGPVKNTITSLTNYLKSSFSYVGARNIDEFRERAEFMQVSPATLAENKTRL